MAKGFYHLPPEIKDEVYKDFTRTVSLPSLARALPSVSHVEVTAQPCLAMQMVGRQWAAEYAAEIARHHGDQRVIIHYHHSAKAQPSSEGHRHSGTALALSKIRTLEIVLDGCKSRVDDADLDVLGPAIERELLPLLSSLETIRVIEHALESYITCGIEDEGIEPHCFDVSNSCKWLFWNMKCFRGAKWHDDLFANDEKAEVHQDTDPMIPNITFDPHKVVSERIMFLHSNLFTFRVRDGDTDEAEKYNIHSKNKILFRATLSGSKDSWYGWELEVVPGSAGTFEEVEYSVLEELLEEAEEAAEKAAEEALQGAVESAVEEAAEYAADSAAQNAALEA